MEAIFLREILQRVSNWARDLDPNSQARRRGVSGSGRGFEKVRELEEEVRRLMRRKEDLTEDILSLSQRLWTALE